MKYNSTNQSQQMDDFKSKKYLGAIVSYKLEMKHGVSIALSCNEACPAKFACMTRSSGFS